MGMRWGEWPGENLLFTPSFFKKLETMLGQFGVAMSWESTSLFSERRFTIRDFSWVETYLNAVIVSYSPRKLRTNLSLAGMPSPAISFCCLLCRFWCTWGQTLYFPLIFGSFSDQYHSRFSLENHLVCIEAAPPACRIPVMTASCPAQMVLPH